MSLSILALVGGGFTCLTLAGGVVGWCTYSKQERQKWAGRVWRDVTLRNGVTEPSPFHAPKSSFNSPGMVEVFPRSRRPASVTESAPVSAALPRPSSVMPKVCNTPVSNGFSTTDELASPPLELSDPPHPDERALCRQLYQEGKSQTYVITTVWGLSKGGSKKYYEGRRRFRQHIADIATGDLLTSIQAEQGVSDA